jgi:eukaryotic-like serine/threonine-protein kinase
MTNDDRSPIVRLESRGARRGAAAMTEAVRHGLVRRRRRQIAASLAAVAVVVIGAGVLLTDSPGQETVVVPAITTPSSAPIAVAELVEVPDVIGLAVGEADALLREAGLIPVRVTRETVDVPVGEVFEQNPGPGRRLAPGDPVELVVSVEATLTVPTVLALPQEEAIATLAELGFTWDIEARSDIAEPGLVIAQDPTPGTVLPSGGNVTLTVSAGPEMVVVPDLEGLTLTEAFNLLASTGFRIDGDPVEEPSDAIAEGLVIRTEPSAGSLVSVGSTIRMVISGELTSVAVPIVVGLFADTALATLRNVGLEPTTEFATVPFGDVRVGLVLDQNPDGFALVPVGSDVVITVGESGPEPPS